MKKFLSLILTLLMMCSLVSIPVGAVNVNVSVEDYVPSAYFKSSGYNWVNGLMRYEGNVTYCIGLYTEDMPRGVNMNDAGEIKDEKLSKIIAAGYPFTPSAYGLSAKDYHYVTQCVVRLYQANVINGTNDDITKLTNSNAAMMNEAKRIWAARNATANPTKMNVAISGSANKTTVTVAGKQYQRFGPYKPSVTNGTLTGGYTVTVGNGNVFHTNSSTPTTTTSRSIAYTATSSFYVYAPSDKAGSSNVSISIPKGNSTKDISVINYTASGNVQNIGVVKLNLDKDVTVSPISLSWSAITGNLSITKQFTNTNGSVITPTATQRNAVRFILKQGSNYIAMTGSAGVYSFSSVASTTSVGSMALDSTGKLAISNLPIGTYTLVESATATGFSKSSDITVTITSGATTSQTVKNTQQKGNLSVTKLFTNTNGNTITPTATQRDSVGFILRQNSSPVSVTGSSGSYVFSAIGTSPTTLKLDSNGKLAISNIPVGTYSLTEINTATGFSTSSDITVTITNGGTATYTVTNPQQKGNLSVAKQFTNTNGSVITPTETQRSAVRFQLKQGSNFIAVTGGDGAYNFAAVSGTTSVGSMVLDSNGKLAISNLPIGTYTLVESATATGFSTSSDITVTITNGGTATYTVTNPQQKGNLSVTKQFSNTNGSVITPTAAQRNAVRFQLKQGSNYIALTGGTGAYNFSYVAGTTSVSSMVLDSNGKLAISNLSIGTYTLVESATTTGFSTSSDITVTITNGGTATYTVTNPQQKGNLSVTKRFTNTNGSVITPTTTQRDSVSFILKQGSNFVSTTGSNGSYVFNALGTTATTLKLDSSGQLAISNLPIGTYTLVESATATGFSISSDITVTITNGGTATYTVTNPQQKGNLSLTKRFTDNTSAVMTPSAEQIDEVTFRLRNASGQEIIATGSNGTYTYQSTSATGTNLKLSSSLKTVVNNLPIGTYTIIETTAPDGFIKSTNTSVTITNATTVSRTLTNSGQTGLITVSKETVGDRNISGIQFNLTGTSDIGTEVQMTATTNSAGNAQFANVPVGTYTVTEVGTTVPYAYLTADSQSVTVSYNENPELTFFNVEKSGKVNVNKTTNSNLNVYNIKFILKGTSDSGREIEISAMTNMYGLAEWPDVPIGTYTIYEDESTIPFAYLVADPQEVSVFYAQTSTVTFENEEKSGIVEVRKTTTGNRNISGIRFILSGKSTSGREIEAFAVTNAAGIATFANIPIGEYTVYEDESTVPFAYLTADPQEVIVEHEKKATLTFHNDEKTGNIAVSKTTTGNKNISGIRFNLKGTSDSGRAIETSAVTNTNGKAQFSNIPIGTYTISEDESTIPFAYLVANPQEVSIFYAQTSTLTFNNKEKVGGITVRKTTEENRNVSDIRFILKGTSDSGIEIEAFAVTNASGIATFVNIPIGEYTVYEDESAVPFSYLTADPKKVNVEHNKIASLTFHNDEKTGSIAVSKTTIGNKNISGIRFNLTGTSDSGRAIETSAVTDTDGVALFENIPLGTYTITEDESTIPFAYLVADPYTVDVAYATTTNVTISNEEKTGEIVVEKSTIGNKNIGNIRFNLKGTSDSGREIEISAVTDTNGKVKFMGIPIGTYTITEDGSTVPYAYLVADPYTVDVAYAVTTNVTISNEEKTGEIVVEKSTIGNKNISGIRFNLKGTSDSGRLIELSAITGADGKATFSNIPVGTYTITEDGSTVPFAYLVASGKEVNVTYSSSSSVKITNEEKTGSIKVMKSTVENRNISNIRFILSGTSDSGREISMSAVTDKDGIAIFDNIPVGTYTITEDGSTVPFAYLVADPQNVTVNYSTDTTVAFFNEEKTGTIRLTKVTIESDNIEGIRFVLRGTADNGRTIEQSAITNAQGLAYFNVPMGTYTIYEDESTVPYAYLTADPQGVTVDYAEETDIKVINHKRPNPETGVNNMTSSLLPIAILSAMTLIAASFSRKKKNQQD